MYVYMAEKFVGEDPKKIEIKNKLLGEKENLQKQLLAYKKEDPLLSPDREQGYSLEDSISQTEGHDRIVATRFELKARLADVENALKKMETGKFGICENCGKDIEEERLIALPEAKECKFCIKSI